jgi:hypothetical protein
MNGPSSLAGWPEINDDFSNGLLDDGAIFSSPWATVVPPKPDHQISFSTLIRFSSFP